MVLLLGRFLPGDVVLGQRARLPDRLLPGADGLRAACCSAGYELLQRRASLARTQERLRGLGARARAAGVRGDHASRRRDPARVGRDAGCAAPHRLLAGPAAAPAARGLALPRQPDRCRPAAARARAAAAARRRLLRDARAARGRRRRVAPEGLRLRGGVAAHGDVRWRSCRAGASSTGAARCSRQSFSLGWTARVLFVLVGTASCSRSPTAHVEYSQRALVAVRVSEPRVALAARAGRRARRRGLRGAGRAAAAAARRVTRRPVRRSSSACSRSSPPRRATHRAPRAGRRQALLFHEDGKRLPDVRRAGPQSWIAMGDPGRPRRRRAASWPGAFASSPTPRRTGRSFYEVGAEELPLYLDLGPVAAQARRGGARAARRSSRSRAARARRCAPRTTGSVREGCTFELVPRERACRALLDELEAISDAWLAAKSTREKGFSVGSLRSRVPVARLPLALVQRDGRASRSRTSGSAASARSSRST